MTFLEGNIMENQRNDLVSLIDKFFVPAAAKTEFYQMIAMNRGFLQKLPGFIEDAHYEHSDEQGNLRYVTVAAWGSTQAIDSAKEAVQAEYERQGFDAATMIERLGITIDRGIYREVELQTI
ncbi:hypothetical protein [Hymenobacter bucti]|uniref:Antibiotic biosynthesis monooxygenase n=1 Tax=Hymenobacter bucti TaxID=1844114 RepID=A0ABW4R187_9BACT